MNDTENDAESDAESDAMPGSGLGTALAHARALAAEGAADPGAGDDWRWRLADSLAAVQDALALARDALLDPVRRATPANVRVLRGAEADYEALIAAQGVGRATLVHYAAVARAFPPGDPLRACGLTLSQARALARLKDKGARETLAHRAIAEALTVGRLQLEVNAAMTRAGGRPQRARVCAWTGRPLTDMRAVVELRIAPQDGMILESGTTSESRKATAGEDGQRVNKAGVSGPARLHFADRDALRDWLAAGDGQARAAGDGQERAAGDGQWQGGQGGAGQGGDVKNGGKL